MLARGHGDKGELVQGAGWHVGTLARGDTARQRYRGAERQGPKIPSQKFGVGWDRREFKSVNYNYLNQL